ncbi:MAG: hypothetical protein FJZ47_16155 [Candidatus Tectomicrobia bacterium]|uniref:Uncharacterized protein n=1 Tax=Tectimicrobiota bacterium TaxID=2528274 RepID=A0A937W1T9_UNCTE|nr:hypothetical protein [Candidatus Tectomicrobia bacterium]
MSEAVHRATQTITSSDLPRMVLHQRDLPSTLREFLPVRENVLDNETMAEQGFPGSSAERFRALGRVTGYMREFAAPAPEGKDIPVGYDLLAATVVHLFEDPAGVSRWIDEVFVSEFCARVDQELHPGQRLLSVERLTPRGFTDEAVGLRVLQSNEPGPISSTIVDFRVGCLLGVVYVATLGNTLRLELVEQLAHLLERRFMQVALEVR